MIGDAGKNTGLAAAANALETRKRRVDPALEQRIQDRFAGMDGDGLTRPAEPDIEGPILVDALGIGEGLYMGLPRRQRCGRLLEGGEHFSRTATIDVGIARDLGDDPADIHPPSSRFAAELVRKVKLHRRAV